MRAQEGGGGGVDRWWAVAVLGEENPHRHRHRTEPGSPSEIERSMNMTGPWKLKLTVRRPFDYPSLHPSMHLINVAFWDHGTFNSDGLQRIRTPLPRRPRPPSLISASSRRPRLPSLIC